MKIALGTLQDEYVLSGEFQVFQGWLDRLQKTSYTVQTFSPVGGTLRAQHFAPSRYGEKLWSKWMESRDFIRHAIEFAAGADQVHLFLPTPSLLWIADRVKERVAKPVIVSCTGEKPEGNGQQVISHWWQSPRFYGVRYLSSIFMPRVRFTCDRYVVSSQVIAHQLRSAGCPDARLVTMPPAIPTETPADELSQEVSRAMAQQPTFLYIGHFLPNKGVDAALNAFARMTHPDTRLVLAWSGFGDLKGMQRQIESLGLTSRVRILTQPIHRSTLFQKCCGLLMPYRASLGQVSPPVLLLEAFRTGVPILVSRLACVCEWAEEDRHVRFINPNDPAGIARAMDALAAHPDLGDAMRKNQQERFAERMATIEINSVYR